MIDTSVVLHYASIALRDGGEAKLVMVAVGNALTAYSRRPVAVIAAKRRRS